MTCDVSKEPRKLENLILLQQLLSDKTRGFEKNISGSLTDGSLGTEEEDLVTWPLTNQRPALSPLTNHKRLRSHWRLQSLVTSVGSVVAIEASLSGRPEDS